MIYKMLFIYMDFIYTIVYRISESSLMVSVYNIRIISDDECIEYVSYL